MNPPDWKRCTAEQLWHYVAWHLENAGIGSVLVGGAAVAIHTEGRYRTNNLDLVPDDLMRREVPEMLRSLGFVARRTRDFAHPGCPHLSIRVRMGPVDVGGQSPVVSDVVEVEGRRLRVISPTDCVIDRLAGYSHWRTRTNLEQALHICRGQAGRVDLGQVERWGEALGATAVFKELKRLLDESSWERFTVTPRPTGNPDTARQDSNGGRAMILVSAGQLQSARRILTRLPFERNQPSILRHALATIEDGTMTLAVTDGDHWLETRIQSAAPPDANERFLIPAMVLADAARSGRGKLVQFDFSGEPGTPLLKTTIISGKAQVRTIHPTEPAGAFPKPPVPDGQVTHVPKKTMLALQIVARFASADASRFPLNGVLFSPENGGVLVATDGRQLACAPAVVPDDRPFVLPNAAVRVLSHPDFTARDAEFVLPLKADDHFAAIRSGPHTLVANIIAESYPDYRLAIPRHLPASATIPETHRMPLVSWLRSLKKQGCCVRLSWEKPGHLTLTWQIHDAVPDILEIPVHIEGRPTEVSLRPQALANALTIGATIRISDGSDASGSDAPPAKGVPVVMRSATIGLPAPLPPCLISDPSGIFCMLAAGSATR